MLQDGHASASESLLLRDAFARDYEAGETTSEHAHDLDQLLFASRGVMTLVTDSGLWVVPPHRALWIPARVRHRVGMNGQVSMRTLYFREGCVYTDRRCRVLEISPLLRELVLELVRNAERIDDDERVRLVGVLLDQLRALEVLPLRLPEPQDPRARAVAAAIRSAPRDDRSLEEFARVAGASTRTLARLFVRETGMTFGAWRQQARLLSAVQRLAAGEPVTSVALEVGYHSPSAFIAMFRKCLGTSPGQYFKTP